MDVVHIQCGKPKQTTTAQKEMMIQRRVHSVAEDSGGAEGFNGFSSIILGASSDPWYVAAITGLSWSAE
jgi:hypothetical protein